MMERLRKQKHINYMWDSIHQLHTDIHNAAFNGEEIDKNKIKLIKKYNRRLRLLEF